MENLVSNTDSSISSGYQKWRLPSLDYLKAICILFVIITHAALVDRLRTEFLFPFWIDMAVPIFMIISGFVYSMSAERKHITRIPDWFNLNIFKPKFMRILTPFVIVYIIEAFMFLVYYQITGTDYSLFMLVWKFFAGGWGPGSYYVPILIQLLIAFPFLFYIFKRNPYYGTIGIITLNLLFEIVVHLFSIEVGIYRLLVFRYLTCVLLGMILYFYRDRIKSSHICLSLLVGFTFILLVTYLGYKPILFTYWTGT